jgi:glucokinase
MIIKHIKKWIESKEQSSITEFAGTEDINCNHLAMAYNARDALAHRAIKQMVKYLGIWTYNPYVTLNINCFVFGGGLLKLFRELIINGKAGNLLTAMKEVFDRYNKNPMPVYFKEAELGDDFGIIGAAEPLF